MQELTGFAMLFFLLILFLYKVVVRQYIQKRSLQIGTVYSADVGTGL